MKNFLALLCLLRATIAKAGTTGAPPSPSPGADAPQPDVTQTTAQISMASCQQVSAATASGSGFCAATAAGMKNAASGAQSCTAACAAGGSCASGGRRLSENEADARQLTGSPQVAVTFTLTFPPGTSTQQATSAITAITPTALQNAVTTALTNAGGSTANFATQVQSISAPTTPTVSINPAGYFTMFWGQLILGVILLASALLKRCFRREPGIQRETAATEDHDVSPRQSTQSTPLTPLAEFAVERIHSARNKKLSKGDLERGDLASYLSEHSKHRAFQDSRRAAFEENRSIFCSHTREEQNFVCGSTDPCLKFPPPSSMEIEQPYYSRFVLYLYFHALQVRILLMRSLGWSLIGGSLGTWICIHHHREGPGWMDAYRTILGALLSDFKWLPTFMLGGHLAFYVQRWRQFMFAAWSVEGRLKDLGIIIGSDVKNPDNPASRRLMFKFYRYMVLSMALQYKAILPPLKDLGPDLCEMLEEKGLLLPEEVPVLKPHASRMRDAVLSWIALEVKDNGPAETGLLKGNCEISVMDKLTELRAKMMFFHGNNYYPQPNVWAAFMQCLVDAYCALMIFIFPITRFVTLSDADLYGFQPMIVVSIFLMTLCFWGALSMAKTLSHPFETRFDTFNIDALIAGTEQTLFTSLRASFDSKERKGTTGSKKWRSKVQ